MFANVCQTCLSIGRLLYPIKELQRTLVNVNVLLESDHQYKGICWECKSIIMKFAKFKRQVREAQKFIHNHVQVTSSLSRLVTNLKSSYDYVYNDDESEAVNDVKVEFVVVKHEDVHIDNSNEQHAPCGQKPSDICQGLEEPMKQDKEVNNEENRDLQETIDNSNEIGVIDNINSNRLIKSHTSCNKTSAIKKTEAIQGNKERISKIMHSFRRENENEELELKKKFNIIIFNEEDMIKHRDDKKIKHTYRKCPFKCESCVLGFAREETFKLHIEKSHTESIGPYFCDICLTRFPTQYLVSCHRQQHYVSHRCTMCKYETPIRSAAVAHCRTRHREDSIGFIRCTQCEDTVATPEELADHKRKRHTICCNECGEEFRGRDTLRAHKKRIHNSLRGFVCDVCNKTFATKTRLESHVVTHDGTLALRLAYCGQCDVQYKNLAIYRNHLRNSLNHSERLYQCKFCQKKFASKVYLNKHRDFYHLRKSQFKCETCDKLFISDYQLRVHNQTRHGENRPRNYPCNICGNKFFTPATLRGHQLTHSDERTYMCEDCGDTFKQKPALYTHCKLVHKGHKRAIKHDT